MSAPVLNVRYVSRAIVAADDLFAQVTRIHWDSRMRAWRTASFGRPYNYSGQVYPAVEMPDSVASIAEVAGQHAGHSFDNCLCNLYETGDHRMGFHTDSYESLEPSSWIAIASLGATRSLVFRSFDRAYQRSFVLEHGSIVLMDAATQLGWQHAVPRQPGAGTRISLTFRRFA
ncbi:MAG: alpha-ketoglutarate-dependent dioxygenase AlkB [Kofleriaceae bacterium]